MPRNLRATRLWGVSRIGNNCRANAKVYEKNNNGSERVNAYQLLCPSALEREEISSSLVSAWFKISYRTWEIDHKNTKRWNTTNAEVILLSQLAICALLWLRTSLQTYIQALVWRAAIDFPFLLEIINCW